MAYQPIRSGNREQKTSAPTLDLETLEQTEDDTPGARILAYRKAAGYSQRKLAELCDPPMDFTAIGRIERNQGYTSSTLKRLATALGCKVSDFFLEAELVAWKDLPGDMQEEIATMIRRYHQAAGNQ